MSADQNDPLRALPPIDADRAVVARTRATALAAFESAHGGSPFLARAEAIWSRFVFPVVLASFVGIYLTMVIRGASALYQ
jgi:hypothetical protein